MLRPAAFWRISLALVWALSLGWAAPSAANVDTSLWTCTGVCGSMGADGVVKLSPAQGSTNYGYVTTNQAKPTYPPALSKNGWAGAYADPNLIPASIVSSLVAAGETTDLPTNGSKMVSQRFSAQAQETLSFYYNYVTSDGNAAPDFAWARLLDASGNEVAMLFAARTTSNGATIPGFNMPSSSAMLSPGTATIKPVATGTAKWTQLGSSSTQCFGSKACGYTDWVHVSYQIPEAGSYQIEMGIANFRDINAQSALAFDGVKLNPPSEPVCYATPSVGDAATSVTITCAVSEGTLNTIPGATCFTSGTAANCTGTIGAMGNNPTITSATVGGFSQSTVSLTLIAPPGTALFEGRVLNDPSGSGAGVGVSGVTVELYKDLGGTAVFQKTTTTDASGGYSLAGDSSNATYYIRVKQPRINGINAAQTWASAGGAQNITSALCVDNAGVTQEMNTSGVCRGVRFAGSDPATHDLSRAQIVTKAVVTTEQITVADFGLSVEANYGDAASTVGIGTPPASTGYRVLRAQGGPFHVTANKHLWLGATVASQNDGVADPKSDGQPSDDGIFLKIRNEWVPLTGLALVNSRTYQAKAVVSGLLAKQGYLNISDNTGTGFVVVDQIANADKQDTAGTGEILFDFKTRDTTGSAAPIITRFRFSTTPGLKAQGAANTTGAGQLNVGDTSDKPWVVDGEVEDYQTIQSSAMLNIAVVSNTPGTFTFELKNALPVAPSSDKTTLTVTTPGVRVDETAYDVHSVWGTQIIITPTPPAGTDKANWVWTISCTDTFTGAPTSGITINASTGVVTVPATVNAKGAANICLFGASYTAPVAESSTLQVDLAGPIAIGNTYTATVTAKNLNGEIKPNTPITLSATGGSLAGTTTGTFVPGTGVCTTGAAGTCVVTWTSMTVGAFDLSAKLAGTDIGGSPTSRTFTAGAPDRDNSSMVVNPSTLLADGASTSTVTVTLKDAYGNTVTTPTTVNFSPLSGAFGDGSLSAATCETNAVTGACSVTYTSPYAVPAAGKATIVANVPGTPGIRTADIILTAGSSRVITVSKSVDGAGYVSGEKFTIRVQCGNKTTVLNLADGEVGYAAANLNEVCRVSEDDPKADVIGAGNSNMAVIQPSRFLVTADTAVAVSNRITSGTINKGLLTVAKRVTGHTDAHPPATVFAVNVACAGAPLTTLNLMDGQEGTVETAIGATCTISEPTLPSASANHYYAPNIVPSIVTVTGATTITVENVVVCETVSPSITTVTVTNVVTGEKNLSGYEATNKTFTVTLNCGIEEETAHHPYHYTWTVAMREGDIASFSVPVNASCSLLQDPAPSSFPALNLSYKWYAHTSAPTSPFIAAGNTAAVMTHNIQTSDAETITITKSVTGDKAGYVNGGKFNITVACGTEVDVLQLADGESQTVIAHDGDACTITESVPNGVIANGYRNEATISPSNFRVNADATVAVTNRIVSGTKPLGVLTVTKTVNAPIGGHDPLAVFAIDVECVGVGSPRHSTLNLRAGQSGTVEAEIGATCTITEPTLPSALTGYRYAASIAPNSVTVLGATAIDVENQVVLDSTMMRAVTISNKVVGERILSGYEAGNDKTFGVTLNCGFGYTWSATLLEGDTATYSVPNGASCSLAPSATSTPPILNSGYIFFSHVSAPTSPFIVTDNTDAVLTHDIQSATTRTLTVTKTVDSLAGGYIDGGKFDITVTCDNTPTVLQLAHGESATVLTHVGETCTVEEAVSAHVVNAGYSNTAVISPSRFIVADNETVAVNNRIIAGTISKETLTLTKTVIGDTNGHDASAEFAITIDCAGMPSATLKLKDGQSGTVEAEIGATCAIREDVPNALSGYKYAANIAPSTVTINGATAIEVENDVVSSVTTMRIVTLTNEVTGSKAASGYNADNATFTVTLNCGLGYLWTSVMAEGDVSTYSVPENALCSLSTHTNALPMLNSGYVWFDQTYSPAQSFAVISNIDALVNHNIQSSTTRNLTVSKMVDSVAGGYAGSKFDITVTCDNTPTVLQLAHGESITVLAQVGQECTVEETVPVGTVNNGHTNTATISPSRFFIDDHMSVAVTNRIVAGTVHKERLTVTKTISSAAGHNPEAVFEIGVDCNGVTSMLNLKGGQSGTVEAESGATCTIDETVQTALTGYWYAPSIAPSTVVVSGATAIKVENATVADNITTRIVTVTHTVDGERASSGYDAGSNKTFTVTLDCGAPYVWTTTMVEGDTSSFSVANSASCRLVTEESTLPMLNSGYIWFSHDSTPTSPFTVADDIDALVTHTIQPGAPHLPTCIASPNPAGAGTSVTITCTGGTPNDLVTIPGSDCANAAIESDGTLICTGAGASLGNDPLLTVSNPVTGGASIGNVPLTVIIMPPGAPQCVATPNPAALDEAVLIACTVEPNTITTIPGADCTPTSATTVACGGTGATLGNNPSATATDVAGNNSTSIVPLQIEQSVGIPLPPMVPTCIASPNPAASGTLVIIICVGGTPGDEIAILNAFCTNPLDSSGDTVCTGMAGTGVGKINNNPPVTVTDPNTGLYNSGVVPFQIAGSTSAPPLPICSAAPNPAGINTVVTINCSGGTPGNELIILGSDCNGKPVLSDGTLVCTGIGSDLGNNPLLIVTDPDTGNASQGTVPLNVKTVAPSAPVCTATPSVVNAQNAGANVIITCDVDAGTINTIPGASCTPNPATGTSIICTG
ncbi:MAG: NF038132 family protein, partial [Proteobacteria bacterium]|nr:NF038132 family protein [Pseudomonadota bacterium]